MVGRGGFEREIGLVLCGPNLIPGVRLTWNLRHALTVFICLMGKSNAGPLHSHQLHILTKEKLREIAVQLEAQ